MLHFAIIDRTDKKAPFVARIITASNPQEANKGTAKTESALCLSTVPLAFFVAKTVAKKALMWDYSKTADMIDKEARRIYSNLMNYLKEERTEEEISVYIDMQIAGIKEISEKALDSNGKEYTVTRLIDERLTVHFGDYFGYAVAELLGLNSENIIEKNTLAYYAINQYVNGLKTNKAKEALTEYFIGSNGDLISIGDAFKQIVNFETTEEREEREEQEEQEERNRKNELDTIISVAFNALSPVEKKCFNALLDKQGNSDENSIEQIRQELNHKNRGTTYRTINNVRLHMIEALEKAGYTEQCKKYRLHFIQCELAIKKQGGKKSAEYYRAYRARKKALVSEIVNG